jgi:hypothetical protein
MEVVATIVFFGMCMAGLGVGLLLKGKELEPSCGGAADIDPELGCGVCSRKEQEVCPSDDPLVALAQIAHPDPLHHR